MEQTKTNEVISEGQISSNGSNAVVSACVPNVAEITPQICPCKKNGLSAKNSDDGGSMKERSYVYALGKIEPRFPSIALEKEFAQAMGRDDTTGLTDPQAFQSVLSKRENRYLVRKICFVMTIEGIETYILKPRDTAEFDLLVEAIRPEPDLMDVDVVLGTKGPIAPPDMCNGLMVPIVVFDQIYSFDRESLIKSIPKPESIESSKFESTARDLFNRIMQMADNAGATDEHRALNYLAVRYPKIYDLTSEAHGRNFSLTSLEVLPSRLSGTRKIVDVVISYTNRNTDVVEKYFVRVDITEEFPFLVTKLSPYYDR